MKEILAYAWAALILSLLTPALWAADSSPAADCTFNPPQALLNSKAYSNYSFTRKANNEAVETAVARHGVGIEVLQSRCEDFLVTEIAFIVRNGQFAEPDENFWLNFAQIEIGRLKRTRSAGDLRDLRQFLVQSSEIRPRNGTRSKCKDASIAEAGQCSWESLGGFIFRVNKDGSNVRVSATEYLSG